MGLQQPRGRRRKGIKVNGVRGEKGWENETRRGGSDGVRRARTLD